MHPFYSRLLLFIALLVLLADVQAQDLSLQVNFATPELQRGDLLQVGFIVSNPTNTPASRYQVRLYGSANDVLDNEDILLGSFASEGVIPPQSFRENALSLDTCLLDAGSWRIIGRIEDVDPRDSNPLNNTATAQSTLTLANSPDGCSDSGPGVLINPGLNDAWYDPAKPGQGILLSVFPDAGIIFLAWFTFDLEAPGPEAVATLGAPGQRWLTASGPWTGNRAELAVTNTSGGIFNSAESPVSNDPEYGILDIEVLGCNNATVSYAFAGVSGSFPIERVVRENATLCEALAREPR